MRNWLKKQFKFNWNDLAWFWLLIPVLVLVVVNRNAQHSLPDDPLEKIKIYEGTFLLEKANDLLKQLVEEKPLDLDLNYRYLQNYCEIYKNGASTQSNEPSIFDYYQNLTNSPESADLGHYGLGYLQACQKHYQKALDFYLLIKNKEQKYLNNSTGYAYKSLGNTRDAEIYYQHEIELNGNLAGAVHNLAELYEKQGEIQKLRALVENEQTKSYVGLGGESYAALRSGQILHYLKTIYYSPFSYFNGFAVICALIICSVWFIYLRQLNIFTQEPFYMAILALLSGVLMALTCSILYDLWFSLDPIILEENQFQDFIFFIFHTGVIEELVKFIPVILILLIRGDRINDPLDLVVYGGLSALGFATFENILYFSVIGVELVSGRFMISTVLHMAETGLLCYLWAKARYITLGNEWRAILSGFCLVAVTHGLFDFIITEQIFAFLLLILIELGTLIFLFEHILHQCVNWSPRSAMILASLTNRRVNNHHLLLSATAALMVISYLYTNFTYATEIANYWFIAMVMYTILCILPVFYPLMNIGIQPVSLTRRFQKKIIYNPVNPIKSS